jgi:LPXTG-site transpeptidase (sortase) family protein
MKRLLQNKVFFYSFICILVTIALYLIISPNFTHFRQEQYSNSLIKEFEGGTGSIRYNPSDVVIPGEQIEPLQTEKKSQSTVNLSAIGILEIPKIHLKDPVVEGATDENIRIAIGHYTPSVKTGQKGASVLFGHNMRKSGLLFNRLYEVKAGDQIFYSDKSNRYEYRVKSLAIVSADQLIDVVNQQTDKSELILITCHYVEKVKLRYVVYAELVQH